MGRGTYHQRGQKDLMESLIEQQRLCLVVFASSHTFTQHEKIKFVGSDRQ